MTESERIEMDGLASQVRFHARWREDACRRADGLAACVALLVERAVLLRQGKPLSECGPCLCGTQWAALAWHLRLAFGDDFLDGENSSLLSRHAQDILSGFVALRDRRGEAEVALAEARAALARLTPDQRALLLKEETGGD